MSHHTATFQICFEKAATTYNAAIAITDRIHQIDETYVQPFYEWAAPRLQDAALSGLCWALIALFDIAHWLNDVTQHYMAINAQAVDVTPEITLVEFAAPGLFPLALCPAMVPLSIHSAFTPVDPGYALLTTILNSGLFSIDTIARNQPSITQDPQPITLKQPKSKQVAPVTKTPAKTPNKAKKNQTTAEAPVTA